jgi:lambda family phage minor tail protein L
MSIYGDLSAFAQDARIELFVLSGGKLGTEVFRFHSGLNEYKSDIVWQGYTYTAIPMQASGFEFTGTSFPRPKVQIANLNGSFSSLVRINDDLIGCKITRKQTTSRYLDAVNFLNGNPNANPSEHFMDEVFFVTQKTAENKVYIEFELGTALDLSGVMLPLRQVGPDICPFLYRGDECGYSGPAVADKYDNPTTILANDKCSKRVSGCKLRFGATEPLSFGNYPGSALVNL